MTSNTLLLPLSPAGGAADLRLAARCGLLSMTVDDAILLCNCNGTSVSMKASLSNNVHHLRKNGAEKIASTSLLTAVLDRSAVSCKKVCCWCRGFFQTLEFECCYYYIAKCSHSSHTIKSLRKISVKETKSSVVLFVFIGFIINISFHRLELNATSVCLHYTNKSLSLVLLEDPYLKQQ